MRNQFSSYLASLLLLLFLVVGGFMAQRQFILDSINARMAAEDSKMRLTQAIEDRLKVQKEKNAVQMARVKEYDAYNKLWSPRIGDYNNTASVLNLLSVMAETDNHLTVGNRNQKDVRLKDQTITEISYEVTGTLPDILNWLTEAETKIDFLRHYSSIWEPQANNQIFVKIVFQMNFKILTTQ
jgi:hypothetical protein